MIGGSDGTEPACTVIAQPLSPRGKCAALPVVRTESRTTRCTLLARAARPANDRTVHHLYRRACSIVDGIDQDAACVKLRDIDIND